METLRDRFFNYREIWNECGSNTPTLLGIMTTMAVNPAIYKTYVIAKNDSDAQRYAFECMKRGMVVLTALVPTDRLATLMSPNIDSFFAMVMILDGQFMRIDDAHPDLTEKKGCFIFTATQLLGEMLYPVNMEQRQHFVSDLTINLGLEPTVTAYIDKLRALNSNRSKRTH